MTLVEVLVASVLLGIGVAGLTFATTLSLRNQQRVDLRTPALYLAQEKIAEIEMIGPTAWSVGKPSSGTETRGNVTYQWTTKIDQGSVGRLFSVLVKVQWSAGRESGQVELDTWLNDYAAMAAALGAPAQPQPNETPNPAESPDGRQAN